jgi:hypothetical protein
LPFDVGAKSKLNTTDQTTNPPSFTQGPARRNLIFLSNSLFICSHTQSDNFCRLALKLEASCRRAADGVTAITVILDWKGISSLQSNTSYDRWVQQVRLTTS